MAYSARHCYSGQRQQQRHSHSVFPFCQKHNFYVCVIARTEGLFKFRAPVPVQWKNIPHSAAQVLAFYRHPFATHNSSCAVYRKFGKWWSTGYFQANTMQSLLSSVVRILPMEFKLYHSRKSNEAACCSHFTSLTRGMQLCSCMHCVAAGQSAQLYCTGRADLCCLYEHSRGFIYATRHNEQPDNTKRFCPIQLSATLSSSFPSWQIGPPRWTASLKEVHIHSIKTSR